ncbi:hypothetical protein FB567DRAFT_36423 [Paraphoma chrysanthemicola]|uniref:Uncharacterized protein n=1 Tax=Paraphoma chrysanthemicola TaxID=798071 RepID=A0A8K0RLS8_9PLEO|nr:hypothetical protein FB567DRAFT_36423 [Paraphoma chrysanthemicola]
MPNHKIHDEHKYSIQRSRTKALTSSLVHVIPVGVTFGILQLSFRNVYWADADASDQRVKLSALQIAAKAHEILILVSMSSMVLHYVRKLLVAPGGMSFGLLEAAYQSGLSSNPWTIGNWEALKHAMHRLKRNKNKTYPQAGNPVPSWFLVVLLVLFAFLALFIGPASAITLIPQLGWWHREDLIGPVQDRVYYKAPSFSVYIPTNLFPSDVDARQLPGSFCIDAAKDTNNTCPSARLAEIKGSLTIPEDLDVRRVQNTTISLSENDPLARRMVYMQSWADGRAAATVPSYVLASFTSLVRLPAFLNRGDYDGNGPFTIESFARGGTPMSPLVTVNCNDTTNGLPIREYSYELDGIDYGGHTTMEWDEVRKTGSFDLRSIWSEEQLKGSVNGTELVLRDVSNTTQTPVLLALMRHGRNITTCSIQSYWTPTSQWILSTSNYDLATNFTFEDTKFKKMSMYDYPYSLNTRKIRIREDWAKSLNAINGSTKILDSVLQYGIDTMRKSVPRKPVNSTAKSADLAYELFEPLIAQILAKAVTNGLSRIGAQHAADHFAGGLSMNSLTMCNERTAWCSEGQWYTSREMPLAIMTNTSRAESSEQITDFATVGGRPAGWMKDWSPMLRSFPKPADADENWTRIEFPVRRYGYAYALQGITTYLSVALLCLHAVIVLPHVIYRIALDCQTFNFGDSLGSLLVLAMGDRAPTGGDLWGKRVAVVPYGNAAEQNRLRIDVVESESRGKELTPRADPEEVVRLVKTVQIEGWDSRYPSVGLHDR